MIKVKGIEITGMKKFLESKRRNRASLLDKKQSKPDLAELHTQKENLEFQRAQRTDGMGGRVEQITMGNSAANGIRQNIV